MRFGYMKKILVIDDESDITLLLHLVLEDLGFKVDHYENPLLAIINFKPGLYDLVILDIKMPNMDGFELHEKIKKIDNKAKILFLTAGENYYEEYKKLLVDCKYDKKNNLLFILKPISNEELVREINRILG